MARTQTVDISPKTRRRRAQTPEERENELINLALDRVQERMENRTATAQEYIQFLRMASSRSRAEAKKTELEVELVRAKTEAIKSQRYSEEKFNKAIEAFKRYSGASEDDDEEEFY